METLVLEAIAPLLDYPSTDYARLTQICSDIVDGMASEREDEKVKFRTLMSQFAVPVQSMTREELEELFTRTFDLNPACSLDIGWHLFGEQYDRGDFLVTMRTALQEHGVREDAELPDHLPSVLRLMARLSSDHAEDLARTAVIPAVDKMLTVFSEEGNPYRALLLLVRATVERLVPEKIGEVANG